MSVTNDMVAAYRRPGKIMERQLASGAGEERALIFLMASCVVFFIAQLPKISRTSHLEQIDMGPGLGVNVFIWLFFMPLALYFIAALLKMGMRIIGCNSSWFHVRLTFFWTLLSVTPLALLKGLTVGLVGPGLEASIVDGVRVIAFFWLLFGSLRAVCKASA